MHKDTLPYVSEHNQYPYSSTYYYALLYYITLCASPADMFMQSAWGLHISLFIYEEMIGHMY